MSTFWLVILSILGFSLITGAWIFMIVCKMAHDNQMKFGIRDGTIVCNPNGDFVRSDQK